MGFAKSSWNCGRVATLGVCEVTSRSDVGSERGMDCHDPF